MVKYTVSVYICPPLGASDVAFSKFDHGIMLKQFCLIRRHKAIACEYNPLSVCNLDFKPGSIQRLLIVKRIDHFLNTLFGACCSWCSVWVKIKGAVGLNMPHKQISNGIPPSILHPA